MVMTACAMATKIVRTVVVLSEFIAIGVIGFILPVIFREYS